MTTRATVYNKTKERVEEATKQDCPRCRGFGGRLGDEDGCELCNGDGTLWVSESGWTRQLYARLVNSRLY